MGTHTVLVNNDLKSRKICSLNDNQLLQLYHLGKRIEKLKQWPQDIEWAIENEKIYIIQARPITTLNDN